MKKIILNPIVIFIIGLILGVLSKILDIYTSNLGNIFSQIAIWILLGTIISIYCETKKKAMLNIFLFCIGMLTSYYITAEITNSVYSWTFINGWIIFACISPIFAYFTWITKEKGFFSKFISVGILLVSVLSSVILFHKLRIYDFIIDSILLYFLFIKKVNR